MSLSVQQLIVANKRQKAGKENEILNHRAVPRSRHLSFSSYLLEQIFSGKKAIQPVCFLLLPGVSTQYS